MVTVIVSTFGEDSWIDLARERAIPSAQEQAKVIYNHGPTLSTYGASLANARNEAALQADTEWIVFLDADDELRPGFIEAMERATGDLRTPAIEYVRHGRVIAPMFWPVQDIRDGNYLIVSTMMRRSDFIKHGMFIDVPMYEDWALFQRFIKSGAVVTQVPEAVCRVHINRNSVHREGSTRSEKEAAHEQVRRINYPELFLA